MASTTTQALNWKHDITTKTSLAFINWNALERYAIDAKRQRSSDDCEISCRLSDEYNMGGLHIVRRIDFDDGTSWAARLQQRRATSESIQRLLQEVHTIQVVRERSMVPVPEIITYDTSFNNTVGAAFMIMEYIPADTAMDSFGGWAEHRGKLPLQFRTKFYPAMAEIHAELASVRFAKIGSVVKLLDGTFSVGPMPQLGGPFESAAEFFTAWGKQAKFPLRESEIRERTPSNHVDEILTSIKNFPSRVIKFAQHHTFQSGSYPVIHSDFYSSNVLVKDTESNKVKSESEFGSDHSSDNNSYTQSEPEIECNLKFEPASRVQAVIDWEGAIVGPWEMVEFFKDLCIVPPAMDGPLYCEEQWDREKLADRANYVKVVRKIEKSRGIDSKLSLVLGNERAQNLAQAISLYCDGRIGFYGNILDF